MLFWYQRTRVLMFIPLLLFSSCMQILPDVPMHAQVFQPQLGQILTYCLGRGLELQIVNSSIMVNGDYQFHRARRHRFTSNPLRQNSPRGTSTNIWVFPWFYFFVEVFWCSSLDIAWSTSWCWPVWSWQRSSWPLSSYGGVALNSVTVKSRHRFGWSEARDV